MILLIIDHSLLIRKRRVAMKKMLVALCGIVISFTATAQSKKYDKLAVLIIDRMTGVIGDFESCGSVIAENLSTTTENDQEKRNSLVIMPG